MTARADLAADLARVLADLALALADEPGVTPGNSYGESPGTLAKRVRAAELLATAGAFIDRRALYDLGLQRRTVEWAFRECEVFSPPDVRRDYVRSDDVRKLIAVHTYTKSQVRPA